jgi:hypothetical protein
LNVTGNIVSNNLAVINDITGANNFVTNYIQANVLVVSVSLSASGNVIGGNVNSYAAVSAVANVTGGNVRTAGQVSATGTITGGNVLTGGIVSATGAITGANITGANILTAGLISATGNVTGGNVVAVSLVSAAAVSATGNVNRFDFGRGQHHWWQYPRWSQCQCCHTHWFHSVSIWQHQRQQRNSSRHHKCTVLHWYFYVYDWKCQWL